MESSASAETTAIARTGGGAAGWTAAGDGFPPQAVTSTAVIPSGARDLLHRLRSPGEQIPPCARDDSGLDMLARAVILTSPAPSSHTSSAPTRRPAPRPRSGNAGRTP